MLRPLRIAITTGDTDGIGSEIVAKALQRLKPQRGVQFYVWRSHSCPERDLRRLSSAFRRTVVSSWPEALKADTHSYKDLIDIRSSQSPAHWVETCAQAAMFGHLDAIATAPLSKTEIINAGFHDIGHTEILRRVAQVNSTHMAFVGAKFNVVLATGHLALREAIHQLDAETLVAAVQAAQNLSALLPGQNGKRPLALMGLNPHASENGLLGNEEREIYLPAIERLNREKVNVVGPLVPDAAFREENWRQYSVFIAPLHDMGLIPFKMVHAKRGGVHITLGLPFVRTSVDHGTAKNIYGKNIADASSMLEALRWALRLVKSKAVLNATLPANKKGKRL